AVVSRFDGIKDLSISSRIDVSRDGRKLVLGDPSRIYIYDTSIQRSTDVSKNFFEARNGRPHVPSPAITPDGDRIIVGFDNDGTVPVAPLDGIGDSEIFYLRQAGIVALSVSPDGRYIAALDKANTIWILDRKRRTAVRSQSMTQSVLTIR